MSWNSRVIGSIVLGLVLAGAPSVASAQRGGHGGGGNQGGRNHGPGPSHTVVVRPSVVISGGYYRPYYYSPSFWDFYYGWGQPFPPYSMYPGYAYGGYPYSYRGYPADSAARIQVTPRETEVYVDGYFAGVVDNFDGFLQRLRVSPGQHVIDLYLDGYRPVSQSIAFQPGETFRIRHAMVPLAPGEVAPPRPVASVAPTTPPQPRVPYDALGRSILMEPAETAGAPAGAIAGQLATQQGSGSISVRVQPSGAVVMIDGERWDGSGPGTRLDVQVGAGAHRVEIHKDGYQPFATAVTVRPGEVTPLNVSLTPQQ